MPPLTVPDQLNDAIERFFTFSDAQDDSKAANLQDISHLLNAYFSNLASFLTLPANVTEFCERADKHERSLQIQLDVATFCDPFVNCAKQWRDMVELATEFVNSRLQSLHELRLRVAECRKPLTADDVGAAAVVLSAFKQFNTELQAGESVQIISGGDSSDSSSGISGSSSISSRGFVLVKRRNGETATVPLMLLASSGDDELLLTQFMRAVGKATQFIEKVQKLVSSKFWAIARSYCQSRSKHSFLFFMDIKKWKAATEILLKLEDTNSTGYSFKSTINDLAMNAINKRNQMAFEVTIEESDALFEFVCSQQSLMTLLAHATEQFSAWDKLWGENWRLQLSVTNQQLHGISSSGSISSSSSRVAELKQQISQHSSRSISTEQQQLQQQLLQQHFVSTSSSSSTTTFTRRMISSSSLQQELHISSSSDRQQQQQQQQPKMTLDVADSGANDIFRVPSRRSSVCSDSAKSQHSAQPSPAAAASAAAAAAAPAPSGSQRGAPLASPTPSLKLSARMQDRQERRAIMDDSSLFEIKFSTQQTMTDAVRIVTDEEFTEQRRHLQKSMQQRDSESGEQQQLIVKLRSELQLLQQQHQQVEKELLLLREQHSQLQLQLQNSEQQNQQLQQESRRISLKLQQTEEQYNTTIIQLNSMQQNYESVNVELRQKTQAAAPRSSTAESGAESKIIFADSVMQHHHKQPLDCTGAQRLLQFNDSAVSAAKQQLVSNGAEWYVGSQQANVSIAAKPMANASVRYEHKARVAVTHSGKQIDCTSQLLSATKLTNSSAVLAKQATESKAVAYREPVRIAVTDCCKQLQYQENLLNATKASNSVNVQHQAKIAVSSTDSCKQLEYEENLLNATKVKNSASVQHKAEVAVSSTGSSKQLEYQDNLLNATKISTSVNVQHQAKVAVSSTGSSKQLEYHENLLNATKVSNSNNMKHQAKVAVSSTGSSKQLEYEDNLLNATKVKNSSSVQHKAEVAVSSTGSSKQLEYQESLLNATKASNSTNMKHQAKVAVSSTGSSKQLEYHENLLNATKVSNSNNMKHQAKVAVSSTGSSKQLEYEDNLLNATKVKSSVNVLHKAEVAVSSTGSSKQLEYQENLLNATKVKNSASVQHKAEVAVSSTGSSKQLEYQDTPLNATKVSDSTKMRYQQEIPVSATGCQVQRELQDSSLKVAMQYAGGQVSYKEQVAIATSSAQRETPFSNGSVSKKVELAASSLDWNFREPIQEQAASLSLDQCESALKFNPELVQNSVLSLGKPIVDNGVFRINELSDNFTQIDAAKIQDNGAFVSISRKDAKQQKQPTRTPQVECGVGGSIVAEAVDMSVQTAAAGQRKLAENGCDAACAIAFVSSSTRGTDMSELHTLCDTGACASVQTNLWVMEDLIIPQQEQPQSAPPPPPPPPAPEPKPVTDCGAFGQTLTYRLRSDPDATVRRRIASSDLVRHKSEVQDDLRELYLDSEDGPVVKVHSPKQKEVPDKEWRYPVQRKDFRPDQSTLPRPQLQFTHTVTSTRPQTAAAAPPISPGLRSLPPSSRPANDQQQATLKVTRRDFRNAEPLQQQPQRQQQPPPSPGLHSLPPEATGSVRVTRRDFRNVEQPLPQQQLLQRNTATVRVTRKEYRNGELQQEQQQQLPSMRVQSRVEPAAGAHPRTNWTQRSLHM